MIHLLLAFLLLPARLLTQQYSEVDTAALAWRCAPELVVVVTLPDPPRALVLPTPAAERFTAAARDARRTTATIRWSNGDVRTLVFDLTGLGEMLERLPCAPRPEQLRGVRLR
jgi:hypothetical protein